MYQDLCPSVIILKFVKLFSELKVSVLITFAHVKTELSVFFLGALVSKFFISFFSFLFHNTFFLAQRICNLKCEVIEDCQKANLKGSIVGCFHNLCHCWSDITQDSLCQLAITNNDCFEEIDRDDIAADNKSHQ